MSRKATVLALLVLVPLGLWTNTPEIRVALNHSVAGALYVVFFCWLSHLAWPKCPAWQKASWVFGVTCALEVTQLWHPPFLDAIRSTFLGAALIGSTFVWMDFPYYLAGALFGFWTMRESRQGVERDHPEDEWRRS